MPKPSADPRGLALALAVLCACAPDVREPEVFAEEIVPLREKWLDICADACMAEDATSACGPFPGDPFTCERFDPVNAVRCYTAYERAVDRKECTEDRRSVKTIVERCDDVWDPCPEPSDSDSGTGGTGDTQGDSEGAGTTGAGTAGTGGDGDGASTGDTGGTETDGGGP